MAALVFDVGGTFIKLALFEDDKISFKDEIETPVKREEFTGIIRDLIKKYKVNKVSFSMPGLIDSQNKIALTAGALLNMYNYDFQKELGDLVEEIEVENDAKCASLAEVKFGSLKDYNDSLCLVIGTGVGGALILDKKPRKGINLASGEVSSIITDKTNLNDSFLWNIYGASGLVRMVNQVANKNYSSGREVFSHLKEEGVKEGIKAYTDGFSVMIYNMQCLVDVECIALGGGVSAQSYLIDSFKTSIDELFAKLADAPIKKPHITACKYHNDSNLYGAYGLLK